MYGIEIKYLRKCAESLFLKILPQAQVWKINTSSSARFEFPNISDAQYLSDNTCGSPHIPSEVLLTSGGCGWNIEGRIVAGGTENGKLIAQFKDDCRAWNPSDVIFSQDSTMFLRTYQKLLAAFGDVFELRDCQGRMWQRRIFCILEEARTSSTTCTRRRTS